MSVWKPARPLNTCSSRASSREPFVNRPYQPSNVSESISRPSDTFSSRPLVFHTHKTSILLPSYERSVSQRSEEKFKISKAHPLTEIYSQKSYDFRS